jgi:hypothetical protein
MGINTTANKTPILMDADQNIGNSSIVHPQAGTEGTVIPQTNPPRILNLAAGGSAAGQTLSVVFAASRIIKSAENPEPGFAGPLTGVVEYGNGGRFTRVELDVPVGPFAGSINEASTALEPQDGLVTITLPTSALRAYVRYDNLLLAPLLGTDPPASHAEVSGVSIVGPGGPVVVFDPADPDNPAANFTIEAEPVLVKVMAAYFAKPHARVYKTLNCYLSEETLNPAPTAIRIGTPSASPIAGYPGYAFWALPAFTKRVKIQRFPNDTALDVLLHDGIRPVDYIQIAGGSTPPEFKVVGGANIIGITSGEGTVTMLKLVCEIGI